MGHLLHLRRQQSMSARTDPRSWTGRPLTLTVVAAGATAWLFAGITQDVLGHDGLAAHDTSWHNWLIQHRNAGLNGLAHTVTYLGYGPTAYAALVIAAVFVIARTHRWREAVLAIAALVVGQLIRAGVSDLVHRARPPRADWLMSADGYAYPSGHTTTATLAWGLVVALLWPQLRTRRRRAAAICAAVVIAAAVGASRAWLGVHWPTDVFGGWALGTLLLTAATAGLWASRRRCRRPAADIARMQR